MYNDVGNNCRARGSDLQHIAATGSTDGGKVAGILMKTLGKQAYSRISTQKGQTQSRR